MSLRKKQPERVEAEDGFIYNAFPSVDLGRGYSVMVPSLALGAKDARRPKRLLFAHEAEHANNLFKSVRIIASCVREEVTGTACGSNQLHLVDAEGNPRTDFFRPKVGMDVRSSGGLPSVMAHEFGIIGLGFVEELLSEAASAPGIGIVTRN